MPGEKSASRPLALRGPNNAKPRERPRWRNTGYLRYNPK